MIHAWEIFPTLLPDDAQILAERADLVLRLESAIDSALRRSLPHGSVEKRDNGRIRVTLTLPGEYDNDWLKLQMDHEAWCVLRDRLRHSLWELQGGRLDTPPVANVVLDSGAPSFKFLVEERARRLINDTPTAA